MLEILFPVILFGNIILISFGNKTARKITSARIKKIFIDNIVELMLLHRYWD